jgi:hypothetical protein
MSALVKNDCLQLVRAISLRVKLISQQLLPFACGLTSPGRLSVAFVRKDNAQ